METILSCCLDAEANEWVCLVCGDVCLVPMIGQCEHFFCQSCCSFQKCPLCRGWWSGKRSRLVANAVSRLRIKCGCGFVATIATLERHKEVGCPHVTCACGLRVERSDYPKHVGVCKEVEVDCFCGKTFPRKDLPIHQIRCKMVIKTCVCGKKMPKFELESHKRTCGEMFVKCGVVGCPVWLRMKMMAKHQEKHKK